MSREISKTAKSVFEQIKRIDENGNEFWSARDMSKVLEYSEYRHFKAVIEKAKKACLNSKYNIDDHFEDLLEMVLIGSDAKREIESVKLSRYACYLIVQNADPNKEIVALGQTYFAIQTRLQEIRQMDEYNALNNELAANLLRATQTEEKLKREKIKGKAKANKTHFEVGKKVRKTIEEIGGTMPENLPSTGSVKKLERKVKPDDKNRGKNPDKLSN